MTSNHFRRQGFGVFEGIHRSGSFTALRMCAGNVNQKSGPSLGGESTGVCSLCQPQCLARVAELNLDRDGVNGHIWGTELRAEALVAVRSQAPCGLGCVAQGRTSQRAITTSRGRDPDHQLESTPKN
jgi:hypothetical protein